MKKHLFYLCAMLFIAGCASSTKLLERGQYDPAIRKAVQKIRKNPTKEKEVLVLEKAFNKANQRDDDRIKFLRQEGTPDVWNEIYDRYSAMKNRQDLVKSVVPLEVASTGRIINFTFVDYDQEIINAKRKAAEYFYNHAQELLAKNDREMAKQAYFEFMRVKELYPNYQDVDAKLKEAKFLATLKVVAEPIPMHSRTLSLSNEFFNNKINEFMLNMHGSEFVHFYTSDEAQRIGLKNPDQIIKLQFDDFVVGQVVLKEKETQLVKDNVVMGIKDGNQIRQGEDKITICHKPPGNTGNAQTITISANAWEAHAKHGDYLGSCDTGSGQGTSGTGSMTTAGKPEALYGTAKATVHLYTKTLISNGLLDFKIFDARTERVLTQEKFPGEFIWQCQWGNFNGDERALSDEQIKAVKNKEGYPPLPQDLFIEFTKPIYTQVTEKIRAYYRNY